MDTIVRRKLEKLTRVTALLFSVNNGVITSKRVPCIELAKGNRTARKLVVYLAYKMGISLQDIAEFFGVTGVKSKIIPEVDKMRHETGFDKFIQRVNALFDSQIIYLAGPVSGFPYEEVVEAFTKAEESLAENGYYPINPVKLVPSTADWTFAMRTLIPYLSYCDALCLLPGWEQSRGVRLELEIANQLGLEIVHLNGAK